MRVIATKSGTARLQEIELAEYVRRLRRNPAGWRAVYVHLSQLQSTQRKRNHIRIAANSFDGLLKKFEGKAFHLSNNDLVAIIRGASLTDLDEVVLKMRYLFSHDPLTLGDADGKSRFCTWYQLERDFNELRAATQAMADGETPPADVKAESDAAAPAAPDAQAGDAPLDALRLVRLEQAASHLDFAKLIRRQPICALLPGSPPRAVFNEIYLSIADIRKQTMPEVDLTANRWLFQFFTETLDRKLLALLPAIEGANTTAASININVASLLSPAFQEFHTKFRELSQKVVVFELQAVDVYGDIGAYLFARDFVRERGYRVCLDGLSPLIFPMIERGQLGLDLEKIVWAPDIERDMGENQRNALRQAIAQAGPSRVILCRCDNEQAIAFGHKVGITLFQGRYIDRLLLTGGGATGQT